MKNILVIDDLALNQELIMVILQSKFPNYEVRLAGTGRAGINMALSNLPETILLDINMPGMNGFEVCEELKSDLRTSNIPILLISALGEDTSIRIKGLKAGADAFITKPFDHSEFEATVNVMLRIKQAEDSLRERNVKLSETLHEIESYQSKLKRLNIELGRAEERERKRLADFLHDGIAQTLSITNIKLSTLKQELKEGKHLKTLHDSSEMISSAIRETRTLIYELNLPILSQLGLTQAIKWKLDQIKEHEQIDVRFSHLYSEDQFEKDIQVMIYRTINELLTNILKHASASLISLDIMEKDNILSISLADNGVGFEKPLEYKSRDESGYGLFRLRERLDSVSGKLDIESTRGSGSSVTVQIPFK
jgi:two-component system, sensor histidine kinase and response regulator